MRRARLLILAAALAILAAWTAWWLGETPEIPSAVGLPATEGPAPPRPQAPERAEASTPALERELVARQSAEGTATKSTRPTLRGRLVLVEVDGTERAGADGLLDCTRWLPIPRNQLIPVTNGAWSIPGAELDEARSISFEGFRSGLRRAAIESPGGLIQPPFETGLLVKARLAPPQSLRILAAENGRDLEGIVFASSSNPYDDCERHPGADVEARILARDLRSPVLLEEPVLPPQGSGQIGSDVLWVGAPGRAWRRVELEFERGGEQTVQLDVGADLTLEVHGSQPDLEAKLVLRRVDEFDCPYLEMALSGDGSLQFSGLPVGSLRAAAELEGLAEPRPLALAALNLRAGLCAKATLELGRVSATQLARASGTLFIHEAWKLTPTAIRFSSLDTPREARASEPSVIEPVPSSRAGFDAFAWKEIELQAGSYEALVKGTGYRAGFDLPAGGRGDIELVVPPPAEVSLLVVDAATGSPVQPTWVRWSQRDKLDAFEEPPAAVAPGVFQFRAPATRIDVEVQAPGYLSGDESLDLQSGPSQATIRLQRACGFTLRLMDGQTSIVPPKTCKVFVTSTLRQGLRYDDSMSVTGRRWTVRTPGTYFVLVPDLPGYEPIALQQVQVPEGGYAEQVIQLERKQ